MVIHRRRHHHHHHSHHRYRFLLRSISTVFFLIVFILIFLFLLAPSPVDRHALHTHNSLGDNGISDETGVNIFTVPTGGGVYNQNIWISKDAEFYYGCSDAAPKFPKERSMTHPDRYLLIGTSGGLNQQRTGIIDAVVAARILNATLVIPKLDTKSFWKDSSNFSDIFNVDWFISNLANDVKIMKEVPRIKGRIWTPHTMRVPRKCNEKCYITRVLPVLVKKKVCCFLALKAVMAGSRIQHNKQHKTRFSSKSSRNAHKVPLKDKHKAAKSERNVAKGARAARLQRSKMMKDQQRAELLKEKRASSGFGSPPRVVVLFGLSASVNLDSLETELMGIFSADEQGVRFPAIVSTEHKLRVTILKAPTGNLSACMEMAKVADLIAFVASASSSSEEEDSNSYIDSFGSQCLSVFRAVGLPSTVVLIRDLPVDSKRRNDLKKSCISSLSSEFPEDCKIYPAETKDELRKFIWLLKEHKLSAPHWRSRRPYVMAQEVHCVDDCTPGKGSLILTGYLRAHSLSVNQLIHVSGAGDFQLSKIELLKDPCPLNVRKGGDLMDSDDSSQSQVIKYLTPDPMKQEPLLVQNVPDPLAGEQTWPTEAEMVEAVRDQNKKPKRKVLPPGTSEYQSAWIVENSDDDFSDGGDSDDDDGMSVDDGESCFPGQQSKDFELDDDDDDDAFKKDLDDRTETESVVDGENPTKEQIAEEIKKIREAHAEDEEYPDEVDTPIDVHARTRFARYRGLKSLRTSSWDPKESLPEDYGKIFAFDNFSRTQKHVIARALNVEEADADSYIHPGSYVRLYVKDVPTVLASKLIILSKSMPIILSGLLQHESKISVLHFSIKKHDTYADPIKSKEELIFHVGFRQFVTRPIYSSDTTMNTDKSKMERFLHPGRFSIASVYAPISFPPLPLIALKNVGNKEGSQVLAAIGSLRNIDLDKVILKKIILTGYPQRVSKVKATVRFMFHNPEDVRWFKPVEVWTKYGRRGRVREPVGTHGAMKCIFNGILQQHDTVCMSLYKRVYPKWPDYWFPLIAS